jgi:hypothetical protein
MDYRTPGRTNRSPIKQRLRLFGRDLNTLDGPLSHGIEGSATRRDAWGRATARPCTCRTSNGCSCRNPAAHDFRTAVALNLQRWPSRGRRVHDHPTPGSNRCGGRAHGWAAHARPSRKPGRPNRVCHTFAHINEPPRALFPPDGVRLGAAPRTQQGGARQLALAEPRDRRGRRRHGHLPRQRGITLGHRRQPHRRRRLHHRLTSNDIVAGPERPAAMSYSAALDCCLPRPRHDRRGGSNCSFRVRLSHKALGAVGCREMGRGGDWAAVVRKPAVTRPPRRCGVCGA